MKSIKRLQLTAVSVAMAMVVSGAGPATAQNEMESSDLAPVSALSLSLRAGELNPAGFDKAKHDLAEIWLQNHPGQAPSMDSEDLTLLYQGSNVELRMTEEFQRQLIDELRTSGLQSSQALDGTVTYSLPDGPDLKLVPPSAVGAGDDSPEYRPMVGGGSDGWGLYLVFSPFEQDLLIAGSGFLLGAAICALPVVGWAVCFGVGAIITAATVWLSHNSKCHPTRPKLKFYVNHPGRSYCIR